MGGAFAIHLAAENILPSVIALIAIDVVEGVLLCDIQSGILYILSSAVLYLSRVACYISWCVVHRNCCGIFGAYANISS
jgi:hypothetical protein